MRSIRCFFSVCIYGISIETADNIGSRISPDWQSICCFSAIQKKLSLNQKAQNICPGKFYLSSAKSKFNMNLSTVRFNEPLTRTKLSNFYNPPRVWNENKDNLLWVLPYFRGTIRSTDALKQLYDRLSLGGNWHDSATLPKIRQQFNENS